MKIYNDEPADWQDLQFRVGKLFDDMGCSVTIEKSIELVRGNVDVDVFIEDGTNFPKLTYICECKNWGRKVSKDIVHSFRTVIADSGANCGYLVSKEGFQSGAYEAINKSNIYLLSWNEFMEAYEDRWLTSMINKLHDIAKPLRDYCNPMADFYEKEYNRLQESEQKRLKELVDKLWLISPLTSKLLYLDSITSKFIKSDVEQIIDRNIELYFNPLTIASYDAYFSTLLEISKYGINQIDLIIGKVRKSPFTF